MRKRIIEPVIRHARSPITARALLVFLMLGLFALVVVFHYIEEQSAERRHRETLQNYQKAEISREEIKQQNVVIDRSLAQLELQGQSDRETKEALQEVAKVLKLDRQERERKQSAVIRAVRRRPIPCYELKRRVTKMGAAEVVTIDLIPKPKCP